jgi:hypothetical protein
MDRGRPLGVPALTLMAHALDAHRPAHRLRQQRRIDPGIADIVAPIGAGARDPDPVHLVGRQAQHPGDPVARKMRLLRAGPRGGTVGARFDDGAGRTHAGMRLKRPLVFRLDDARGTREGRIHLADGDGPRDRRGLALARKGSIVLAGCPHYVSCSPAKVGLRVDT